MTNVQLFLAVGLPILVVLAGIIQNNRRFDAIDKRFDLSDKRVDGVSRDMDRRFEAVDRRFDKIESRLDAHDRRFNELQESAHKDALAIMKDMTDLHSRVAVVESRNDR